MLNGRHVQPRQRFCGVISIHTADACVKGPQTEFDVRKRRTSMRQPKNFGHSACAKRSSNMRSLFVRVIPRSRTPAIRGTAQA